MKWTVYAVSDRLSTDGKYNKDVDTLFRRAVAEYGKENVKVEYSDQFSYVIWVSVEEECLD